MVFQFVPAVLMELFIGFWQDVDPFARSTQPLRAKAGPNGGVAIQGLLLNFGPIPPWIVTYTAVPEGYRADFPCDSSIIHAADGV